MDHWSHPIQTTPCSFSLQNKKNNIPTKIIMKHLAIWALIGFSAKWFLKESPEVVEKKALASIHFSLATKIWRTTCFPKVIFSSRDLF